MRRRSAPVMTRGGPSRRRRMACEARPRARRRRAGSRPVVHDLAKDAELADVIGSVIDDEHRLAQNRLAVAVRDAGVEIRLRMLDEGDHLLQVAVVARDGLVPVFLGRLRVAGGPIVLGEAELLVVRVPDEIEDVPLCDTDVLEEMPEGVRHMGRSPIDVCAPSVLKNLTSSARSARSLRMPRVYSCLDSETE